MFVSVNTMAPIKNKSSVIPIFDTSAPIKNKSSLIPIVDKRIKKAKEMHNNRVVNFGKLSLQAVTCSVMTYLPTAICHTKVDN